MKFQKGRSWAPLKVTLLLVAAFFATAFVVEVTPVYATPAFVQQVAGASKGTGTTFTCVFGSNVSPGNLLIASIGWVESSSRSVSSVAKSAGTATTNTFVQMSSKSGGSTVVLKGEIWAGVVTSTSAGSLTLQVTMSGTTLQSWLTCLEFSGASPVNGGDGPKTGGATTAGASSYSMSTTALTPVTNDLLYAFGVAQPCGASGTITYDAAFTAGTAQGTDWVGATNCKSVGSVKYRLNAVDEYLVAPNTNTRTAAFTYPFASTIDTGTWGWIEMQVDFKQSVTINWTLTVSPVGAPQVTATVSGCADSPTTVLGDGGSHAITLARDCVETITLTSGSNQRYVFGSNNSATHTQTSPSSGSASKSYTYYDQVQNTYTATANGKSTFDSGISGIALTGTEYGVGGSAVCTVSPTSGASSNSCTAYADYNLAVGTFPATLTCGSCSPAQWATVTSPLSWSDTTGGNTHTVAYWKQWAPTLTIQPASYSGAPTTFDAVMTDAVIANTYGTTATLCTITTSNGGSSASCAGTNWIDHGSYPVFQRELTSPPANEIWRCSTCGTAAAITSASTVTISYFNLLAETFTAQIGTAQPNFDDALTTSVTGQLMGTGSSTLCSVKTYGTSSTSQACNGVFALVQSIQAQGATSFATAPAGGNTIYLAMTSGVCNAVPTDPSPILGNSYTSVAMTKIVSSATQTVSNTNRCSGGSNLWEWKTYIYAARWTVPDTGVTGQAIRGVTIGCPASHICNGVFGEYSGWPSVSAVGTTSATGSGSSLSVSSFTPTAGDLIIVAGGACGTQTYTAGTNYVAVDQIGGGSCTSGSATIDSRLGMEHRLAAPGTSETAPFTLSGSETWNEAVAWFHIGSTYIDSGKAATFDTSMGNPPANTRWQCSTCTTATQSSGGGTPTITYWKSLKEYPACRPTSPTTWDAIYVCKGTGDLNGVSSSTVFSFNTAAGGGRVNGTAYFQYGATTTWQTPLGNTWDAATTNTFSFTTTLNIANVNYTQSGATTVTTTVVSTSTSTSIVADPPNYLWLVLIPIFMLLFIGWGVKRRL